MPHPVALAIHCFDVTLPASGTTLFLFISLSLWSQCLRPSKPLVWWGVIQTLRSGHGGQCPWLQSILIFSKFFNVSTSVINYILWPNLFGFVERGGWQGWPLAGVPKSCSGEMLKQCTIGLPDCMTAAMIVHTSRGWTRRFTVSRPEPKLISMQDQIWMHME